MQAAEPQLLRTGLLDGVRVLVAGLRGEPGASVRADCAAAGARVAQSHIALGGGDVEGGEAAAAESVKAALAELGGGLDVLVVDAAAMLAAGGSLGAVMQGVWDTSRAAAQQALIGHDGGRIVLLAPACASDAGRHAAAALAGLENLARTLSIEWARHAVTCVAVAPGEHTRPAQIAQLVAYLASPAGAYFSGCLLDLRAQAG